jgi:hypothetical protein
LPRQQQKLAGGGNGACPLNATVAALIQPWRLKLDDVDMKRVVVVRNVSSFKKYETLTKQYPHLLYKTLHKL